jgi:transposase
MSNRISIAKEDRIWALREQGYLYNDIAKIVNTSPSLTTVIRRVRNRPPIEKDPVRRGRVSAWLSDSQVEDIKRRKAAGETYLSIAKSYNMDPSSVCDLVKGRTYSQPETPYPYDFSNRLARQKI